MEALRKSKIEIKQEITAKLDRANELINLAEVQVKNWKNKIQSINLELESKFGDMMIASAQISFTGIFPQEYRKSL